MRILRSAQDDVAGQDNMCDVQQFGSEGRRDGMARQVDMAQPGPASGALHPTRLR